MELQSEYGVKWNTLEFQGWNCADVIFISIHHFKVGKFLDSIRNVDKIPENDQDVVIEEDIWRDVNVTILKGVISGRVTIVAAVSVVTKSCPHIELSEVYLLR